MRPFALLLLAAASLHALALSQTEVFGYAQWIGGDDSQLPLSPATLTVFNLDWTIDGDADCWLTFGASDPRLADPYKNIWHATLHPDSAFVMVDADRAAGQLRVTRRNMPGGTETLAIAVPALSAAGERRLAISCAHGHADFWLDGESIGSANLNPAMGDISPKHVTGDYLAFPCLGNVRYSAGSARVANRRAPGNSIAEITPSGTPSRGMLALATEWHQPQAPQKATITLTARGIYDAYANGQPIAPSHYFLPGFTQYDRTHLVQTYDITPLVVPGDNRIEVALGEGWWSGPATYSPDGWNWFGDRQSLIAKIEITEAEGSVTTILTSPDTWQAANDPRRAYASFFQGESIDATAPAPAWRPATAISTDGTTLPSLCFDAVDYIEQPDAPVHPIDTLAAASATEVRPGVWLYDMGQNHAGVPHITLRNQPCGTKLTLRYGEVLYPTLEKFGDLQGELLIENLRAANSTDTYTCQGAEIETFSPRQTMHGYRYIEVAGTDAPLPPADVKSIALSSLTGTTASYECSNAKVNKLWDNILWSMRSNFVAIPTDCPQRNERMGWSGDINVFSHTAAYCSDTEAFLRRHARALRDTQRADGRFADVAPLYDAGFGGLLWGSAGVVVPWQCWLQWGDSTIIAEQYDAMERYIQFIESQCIDPESGLLRQTYPRWGDLGDWLSPEDDANDPSLLWEAYYIHLLDIMSQASALLGYDGKADAYARGRDERRRHFCSTYLGPDGRTVHSALAPEKEGQAVDTYTSYVLPLAFGIWPDDATRAAMARRLATLIADHGYTLRVGFIGVPWICEVLTQQGRDDLAYSLLACEEYPSWLYSVDQGSTTIWERLNSYVEGEGYPAGNAMNSFNHYSFGSVGSWLIERSLGIKRDEGSPGFAHFLLQPAPDPTGNITWARGHYDSRRGRIESSWRANADGTVTYAFAIPEGTTATVLLPGAEAADCGPGRHEATLPFPPAISR